jgi:hypothetical protein
MMQFHKVFEVLNIAEFDHPDCYALRMNGRRVFLNKWETGTVFVKEISQESLWQIIALLKEAPGELSSMSITDFLLVKYVDPYVIRINFPPTSSNYYVDIYKIGSKPVIRDRVTELWQDKAAYRWLGEFVQELSFQLD